MAVEMLSVRCFHRQAVPAFLWKCRAVQIGGTPSVRPLRVRWRRASAASTFPVKKHTVRLCCIPHAKLAPDYHRISSVRRWTVFRSCLPNPPPAESAHEGDSHGKNPPKLGEVRWKRSVFWLLFAALGKKLLAIRRNTGKYRRKIERAGQTRKKSNQNHFADR